MNEKQLQALIRKNMAKVARPQGKGARWQDPTISATNSPDRDDSDAEQIFKEMKKREF
jgi:hypothetical protein